MVVELGAVGTELTEHITHTATKEATEQFVKDTAIRPEDIAEVIAFAVSRPRRMTLNEILVARARAVAECHGSGLIGLRSCANGGSFAL